MRNDQHKLYHGNRKKGLSRDHQIMEESPLQKAAMDHIAHILEDLGIPRKHASNSTREQSTRAHQSQQRNLTKMADNITSKHEEIN